MFGILNRTVTMRIEGTMAGSRETAKMWFVRLLEILRKYILDDHLVFGKNLIVKCFPPYYEVFRSS